MLTDNRPFIMLRLKVFLSILWLVSSKQICPQQCSCQWKNSKNTIDCTNKNFQIVPVIRDSPSSYATESPFSVALFDRNNLNFISGIRLDNLGYKFIQKLSFKQCRIEDLPIGLFDELGSLMTLDLSQNQITSIENEYFNNLPNLATLDLSENQITHIAANAFTGLLKLKNLDLSTNKINSLNIQDFAAVDKARRSLKNLTKLLLYNNPLSCDCYIGRLYAQMKARKNIDDGGSQCHDGKILSQMELKDFECGPIYLSSTPRQLKRTGENATLQCKFEANPAPSIKWFFKDKLLEEKANNPSFSITKDAAEISTIKSILRVYKISSDSVGDYACFASNQFGNRKIVINVSQANPLFQSTDSTILIIVGVTVSVLVLVSAVSVFVYCIWIRKKSPTNQSSFAILNSSTSLPPMRRDDLDVKFTNPIPKPPRTGVYNNNFLNSVDCSTLGRRKNLNMPGIVANDCFVSHYISNHHLVSDPRNSPDFLQSPELLTMINNQPGSRSSVGTLSTSVSSYQKNEYHPYPTPTFLPQFQRNQTHPPQNYSRPGYVTLPRRPRSRPVNPFPSVPLDDLGPRTRGDGSSLHSIDSRLMLPPLNNNNNNNVLGISDKYDITVGELDTSMSVTEVDDSPPNRQVLDTIIEQD